MPIWTFVDYVEASGRNPFAEWMDGGIPLDAKVTINARFTAMMSMARWPEKWVSNYEGYPGLLEARIPFNKVQYRPLFTYSLSTARQIVLLSGAIEKGSKIPKSVLNAAYARREDLVGQDRARRAAQRRGRPQEPERVRRHKFT
jgi:hypothetical protein